MNFPEETLYFTSPAGPHDFCSAVDEWAPTGSRAICNPAPTTTDEDFITWVQDDAKARIALEAMGYRVEGAPDFYTGNDNGGFRSYRKGDVNVITTPDYCFYSLFCNATALARRLNLLDKADRIALFQLVLYGVDAQDWESAQ